MKTGTLQVPGASLYYEVRGSGPVLLMIPGGPMGVYQTAHALAGRLGTQPVQFPGDHSGFGSHPDEFAVRLREVLAAG